MIKVFLTLFNKTDFDFSKKDIYVTKKLNKEQFYKNHQTGSMTQI